MLKSLLFLITLLFVTSCADRSAEQSSPAPEISTNVSVGQSNVTATNKSSTAPQVAPNNLVRNLYKQHDAQKSPFFQSKNRALVDKYFTLKLADLIWKDSINSQGQVGALDSDPLYNSQDPQPKNFAVTTTKISQDEATVLASFLNYSRKETISFALVQQNGNWKIADIKYGNGNTLLKLLSENSQ
ncbi:MAG TPA: DUF3828 domain-containing protein [Oculatellaceae cyanobacterium]|jgi:hypothetical protein